MPWGTTTVSELRTAHRPVARAAEDFGISRKTAFKWLARKSPRSRPAAVPVVEYPPGAVLRKVGGTGGIRWRRAQILAGNGLIGEFVRVEEQDGSVTLWYGTHRIWQIPVDRLGDTGLL